MDRSRSAAARRRATGADAPRTGKHTTILGDDEAPLVLIVDDADDVREIYSAFFVDAGLRVSHAVDGDHALLKVMALTPDLVVMDLAMPILDGWEAIRAMKAHPRTKHIPVIALTGHVTTANLKRAEAAGAAAVLIKPCEPSDLVALVKTMLDR
jgi:CheY-like chemotaxis protein